MTGDKLLWALLVLVCCYLIGSIPFPILVSRWVAGIDLREYGSGNMGAMNAARVLGKRWFLVVFGLDFCKGLLAASIAQILLGTLLGLEPPVASALGGLAAVVGHCFPALARFKGGVGLAASAGAIARVLPLLLVTCGVAALLFWTLTRNQYVGVALAALAFPAFAWLLFKSWDVTAVMVVWGLILFGLHYKDVRKWLKAR